MDDRRFDCPPARRLPQVSLTRVLSVVTAASVVYFVATLAVQHVLRPAYDPVTTFISAFVVGRYGSIQVAAFLALGLGVLCLAAGLRRTMASTLWLRAGLTLLAVCGIMAVVAGLFRTDLQGAITTATGVVHGTATDIGYISLVWAMFALSLHFWRDARWRQLFPVSLLLAVLGLVLLLVVFFTLDTVIAGLSQRLFGLPVFVWLLMVSVRLAWLRPTPATQAARTDGASARPEGWVDDGRPH